MVFMKNGKKKWNIDHIIPQSRFSYDSLDHPDFLKCWALENLRPIEILENIRKSDTVDDEKLKKLLEE